MVYYFLFTSSTKSAFIARTLLLSWLYAACSQIIIPLPFNVVPLSLQPAPLFIATFFFGWHAVNAYWIYLIQGACGLPFFSRFGGGLAHLLGPTGGYLIGWGLAMMFIAWAQTWARKSFTNTIATLSVTFIMYFACGLFQLALFVPINKVLVCGLYPFLIGDLLIKPAMVVSALGCLNNYHHLLNKPRK